MSRRYEATVGETGAHWSRASATLAQRFTITPSADGTTMHGTGEMSTERGPWEGDLELRYVRIV